jgi:uncharacterized protein with ParB-like and HNH nuclease domain
VNQIIGTVIEIGNFLSPEAQSIVIQEQFTRKLDFNRTYIIPDFQREIRWDEEQIVELINNIGAGAKFLGNVILSETKRENGNPQSLKDYEIIDGQQRITTLLMIFRFIQYKYGNDLNINGDLCPLRIQSFAGFATLYKHAFSEACAQQDSVKETDDLNQIPHYLYIWNIICEHSQKIYSNLRNKYYCKQFLDNLMGSTINVIINTSENTSRGIKLFLDVNLKGKKLDTEDVFKSYLFSRDDSNNTFRSQWVRIKKLSSKLLISRAKQQKNLYPLMEIIRHSFYCSLYKEKYFKNIEISQEFCLSKAATIPGESEAEESLHYRGEHIIEVLENQTFLTKVLKSVEHFLVMATDVVNSHAPSQDFENYFDVETGKSVDFVTVSIAHCFIKRILYDDAILPKAVLFKYFVTTLAETQKCKDDYKWIFDVYAFNVLFNISAAKKQKDVVLNIVAEKKDNADWHIELSSAIQTFLCETGMSRAKVAVQYKYLDEDFNEEYLSKGLAALYNYFTISKGRCSVKNEGALKDFLTNTNSYTLEHLIINKSKKYELNGGKAFTVRGEAGKCANSMFNFIFISESFNGRLKNKTIREKMDIIAKNMQEIKCDYSKKVLEFVQKYFIDDPPPSMMTSPFPDLTGLSYDEKIEKLDAYLSNEDNPFFKTFFEFASEVLKEVYRKVIQK